MKCRMRASRKLKQPGWLKLAAAPPAACCARASPAQRVREGAPALQPALRSSHYSILYFHMDAHECRILDL